nr:hypothetical protein [uncultured Draconibacterium sp.]
MKQKGIYIDYELEQKAFAQVKMYSAQLKADSASHKEAFRRPEYGSAQPLAGFRPMKMAFAAKNIGKG